MASIPALEQSAVHLLEAIQAEWEHDLAFTAWLGVEGERVRDSALALVQAVKSGTLHNVLGGMSVHTYLGESWLEVHSRSRGLADDFHMAVSGE